MITLADRPLVGPEAIRRLLAHRGPSAAQGVRASYGRVPGHPVLLERALFSAAGKLRGDPSARALLDARDMVLVACDDVASPDDVDTPDQLHRLRARPDPMRHS